MHEETNLPMKVLHLKLQNNAVEINPSDGKPTENGVPASNNE